MAAPIITGSWIDIVHGAPRDGVYWNRKTLAYTEEEWAVLVRHLRRDLGIELLLLQNVAKDGLALYPSKVMKRRWATGCADPVGAIARACSAEGVAFYPGIGFPPERLDTGADRLTDQALDWYRRVTEEVLERYGGEPCLSGLYCSAEIGIFVGIFSPDQVAFTRRLTDMWRAVAPGLPAVASPWFRGDFTRTDLLARSIADTGLSVIAYQDGQGFTTPTCPLDPARNACAFETLRWAHDQTEVALWANVELFRFENDIHFQPLLPGPFARIRTQLRAAAPHVDRVVAYTLPGLMTSQDVCPGLGVPETERLYWAYQGYRESVESERLVGV